MGWCPYSCFQRCQEALRKQQHENWRSKALLREAWLTAYQQYSSVFKVATCGNNHDLQRSQWFIFQHLCFPHCTLQFLRPFRNNTGKKLACAIWPCNPLMWVSNLLSSIENGGNYVSWKYLVQRGENILVKIVFDQICLHTFFILRFVCNQPGNESPQKWNHFLNGATLTLDPKIPGPSSLSRRSIGFLGEELGRKVDRSPDVLGQSPCKLDKVKITRSKPLESLAHLFNEFFFVEDFGILGQNLCAKAKVRVSGFPIPWD